MKIALITDIHIGARSDNLAIHAYFKKFYDTVFFPYLEKHKIKHIVDLGDTVDRRKYINFLTLHYSKEYYFDKIEQHYNYHMIVGNHSTYHKNSNHINSSNLLFSKYNNFHIYSEAKEVEFDECKILFVPWICMENEEDTFRLIRETKAQILFGHLQLAGFEMYKGTVIDAGYESSLFDKFDVVCSGHFHHKSSKGNINYLGTPYEMSWSDYNDPKGFHIFDTETRALTFIKNPYKIHNKIFYDDKKYTIENINEIDFEKYRETYIKLIVKNKINPYFFDLFLDKLEKVEPMNLQIIEEKLQSESIDDVIDEAKDTLSILTESVDGLDGFENKKQLKILFTDLYNEALRK